MTKRFLRARRASRLVRVAVRGGRRAAAGKVRTIGRSQERKDAEAALVVTKAAQDIALELGQMKGVMMKAGQLLGFILEALPDDAQAALATLQADAPPMASEVAAAVVRQELGDDPARLFAVWNPNAVAAASIGQVHRATLHDGREVAVKVQYPGIGDALDADFANAQSMYAFMQMFALKGLDTKALVAELRDRMQDELDYSIEAANQQAFAAAYAGHPYFRIPQVVAEMSTSKVLTTEWVDGQSWAQFFAEASPAARQRAGEIVWRFAQGSVHELGMFNGDPHPGNYRFHPDGSVTFLDFGLIKRWAPGEWAALSPSLDAILDRDAEQLVSVMEDLGFLPAGHGLDPADVFAYVSQPYMPYLADDFTFTREFVRDSVGAIMDVKGPSKAVVERLNMPASFVILDRVVWGVSALLGKLELGMPWRSMLLEYRRGTEPQTELGVLHSRWKKHQ